MKGTKICLEDDEEEKRQKQMPWVNAFKAVQKPLAFTCCAKENDLMNGKGRTNRSMKKINEGRTGRDCE